jgi:hypothetical protein
MTGMTGSGFTLSARYRSVSKLSITLILIQPSEYPYDITLHYTLPSSLFLLTFPFPEKRTPDTQVSVNATELPASLHNAHRLVCAPRPCDTLTHEAAHPLPRPDLSFVWRCHVFLVPSDIYSSLSSR